MDQVKHEESIPIEQLYPEYNISLDNSRLLDLLNLAALGEKLCLTMAASKGYHDITSDSDSLMFWSSIENKIENARVGHKRSITIKFPMLWLNLSFVKKGKTVKKVLEDILTGIVYLDQYDLELWLKCCATLFLLAANSKYITSEDDVALYDEALRRVIEKSNNALGYKKAELINKKRHRKNLDITTTRKQERINQLKEWMKTMKPKEYRRKAQDEWDLSERQVLNYIKEIREEEKTAILRKNNDIS